MISSLSAMKLPDSVQESSKDTEGFGLQLGTAKNLQAAVKYAAGLPDQMILLSL